MPDDGAPEKKTASGTKRIATPSQTKKIVSGTPSATKKVAAPSSSSKKAAADKGLGLAAFPCVECGKPLADDAPEGGTCIACASSPSASAGSAKDEKDERDEGSKSSTPSKQKLKTKSRTRADVAERSGTPTGRRGAAPAPNNNATLALVAVIVVALVAGGFILVRSGGGGDEVARTDSTDEPVKPKPKPIEQPKPSTTAAPSASAGPATNAATPVPPPKESVELRQQKLQWMVEDALALQRKNDLKGAKKKFLEVRAAALPQDAAFLKQIDSMERDLDKALKATGDDDEPAKPLVSDPKDTRPDPGSQDGPKEPQGPKVSSYDSMKNYTSMRRMLDPHMAHLELDEALKIVSNPPDIAGAQAKDLADDKLAIAAMQSIADLASAYLKKQLRQELTFRTWANGKTAKGRITKVDGVELGVSQNGAEQGMKLSDIEPDDLCAWARTGLPADQRQAYLLGRALLYYYGSDDLKAKKTLAEKELASNELALAFVSRINRDGIRPGPSDNGKDPVSPKDPGGKDGGGKDPAKDPAKDPGKDQPGGDLAESMALLRRTLHVNPGGAGNGMVALNYNFGDDAQPADFENKGLDECERNPSNDPNWGGGTGLRLAAGLSGGMALLKCPFKGDFTLDVNFQVEAGPSGASLVFFVGSGPGKKATGASWDGRIVEMAANGTYQPKGGEGVDINNKYKAKATNTIKIVREGTRVTYTFNGLNLGNATFPAGEGRAGILVGGMRIIIRRFNVSGQLGDLKKDPAFK